MPYCVHSLFGGNTYFKESIREVPLYKFIPHTINIYFYCLGRPNPPTSATMLGSQSQHLTWTRPDNIQVGPLMTYMVTANSSMLGISLTYMLEEITKLSLLDLEKTVLNGSEICQIFTFSIVARLEGVEDSDPALFTDTIPLCRLLCWWEKSGV